MRLLALPIVFAAVMLTFACDSNCVEAPALAPSDLSCDSDGDCAAVWSGSICYDGCDCTSVPANVAAQARMQSALSSVLNGPNGCPCPSAGTPRCFAHECVLCAPGDQSQSAACQSDAGADGG